MMQCLLRALSDEEVEVRGNALYATGLAYVHGSDRVDAHVPAVLAALEGNLQLAIDQSEMVRRWEREARARTLMGPGRPPFHGPLSWQGHVVDNACGCAGRLLRRYVAGTVSDDTKQTFAHLVARCVVVWTAGRRGFHRGGPALLLTSALSLPAE